MAKAKSLPVLRGEMRTSTRQSRDYSKDAYPGFMLPPSRSAFWRFVLGSISVLALLAARDVFGRANQMGVDVSASPSWQVLLALFSSLGLLGFIGLALSFTPASDRLWEALESPGQLKISRIIAALLSLAAVMGPTIVLSIPYVRTIFGREYWVRFLIFWLFSLLGMWSIRMFRQNTPWLIAFIVVAICQGAASIFLQLPSDVTSYPFAMGWSETSRFYYPSLFLSEKIYGQESARPFINTTLSLLLSPPYLLKAPLWFHRLWLVTLRVVSVALIAAVLTKRLSLRESFLRWVVGVWIFLFLFAVSVYAHLAVPIIIMLLGFSSQNDRRAWITVILASIWAGWSRINWYPVPGIIAAALYFLEVPFSGKSLRSYLRKPALWFFIGSLVAFGSQQIYIVASGVPDAGSFYTSFASELLWYRLMPNATYTLGILPAAILVSLPLWLALFVAIHAAGASWHPARLAFLVAALATLFIGGIVVSLKIGGGADLHNLDAYFILLLIILSYMTFARLRKEVKKYAGPVSLHWLIVLWIAITPVWMSLPSGISINSYDRYRTNAVLAGIQRIVDRVNAADGEILFITQRHLVSMGMVNDVPNVREYEREELMEMAMSNNQEYLGDFRVDMENQRFDVIVVDPLTYSLLGPAYPFGEENNAWVQKVMKHILCNYREETVFLEDRIAIYVPQQEERQCPVIGSQ